MTRIDLQTCAPAVVRQLCRDDKWTQPATAGCCDGHVQANVIILPEKYAADFRLFCKRNPVPCPLLGETIPGDPTVPDHLAAASDIRFDCPSYSIYQKGKFIQQARSIEDLWRPDSVAFFIGCSYSFEAGLIQAGLVPRHIELGRAVPMYRTKVPLAASGRFAGTMVVSMRPYPVSVLDEVRRISRPFVLAHGEPFAYGLEGMRALGIDDPTGTQPDFGEPSVIKDGEVPVYWGCGVTPQNVVMSAGLDEIVIGHTPGQMLVLDMRNEDACEDV